MADGGESVPVLTKIVSRKKVRFPLEIGIVTDYDEDKNLFTVYLPKRKKTLNLPPPPWMMEKITIPAESFQITIPSQTVTDSAGDNATIPAQTISFPDEDIQIDRFDMKSFIGYFAVVVNPVSRPMIVGFTQKVG